VTVGSARGGRRTASQLEAAIDENIDKGPSRWEPAAYGIGAVVVLFVFWQVYVSITHISPLLLPSLPDIVTSFRTYASSGQLGSDLGASAKELFGGYLLACVAGIVIGLLAGWYKYLGFMITPWASFFLAVPIIAITPLIIIWVGLNLEAKIIIVALSAFFPILLNTMAGVRDIDKRLIRLERSYCASNLQILRTLALPSAVPYTLTGMRIGVCWAIVGVYVAEISNGSSQGIGYMMSTAASTFQTAQFFVGLFIIGVIGILLTSLVGLLQRRLQHGRTAG
jgi:ABC-type nitrate/sulfonate/bicarbonate transport system permease component